MYRYSMRTVPFLILLLLLLSHCYSAYFYESKYCNEDHSTFDEKFRFRYKQGDEIVLPADPVEGLNEMARITIKVADTSSCGLGIGGPCFLPFIPYPVIDLADDRLTVEHRGLPIRFNNLMAERDGTITPLEVLPEGGIWTGHRSYIVLPSSFIRKDLIISADDVQIEVNGAWTSIGPLRFTLSANRSVVLRFFNNIGSDSGHIQWVITYPRQCKKGSAFLPGQ